MKSEKRMVGDYTVLCAVNIGSREIILAENEQDKNGERFLCCYGERNDIFQRYSECAVGDDYIDAALFFAERIKKDANSSGQRLRSWVFPRRLLPKRTVSPTTTKMTSTERSSLSTPLFSSRNTGEPTGSFIS